MLFATFPLPLSYMKIAISITTHNRYEVFKQTYENTLKYLPDNATLFVVDDGSDIPVKEATYRFYTPQGIAAAKNKCFELADGFDYHFALDDDVYPRVPDWHLPYINSGMNHLCFTFDKFSNGNPNGRKKIGEHNGLNVYQEPCGLMNFYTKECFDTVGGMDTDYGLWSYEHVGHSMRIHNAGLTPFPFMDIPNSLDLFYSFDWDQTTKRSVDARVRAVLAHKNQVKYRKELKSAKFIPYKAERNLILTSYFTTLVDPQRGAKWEYDDGALDTLRNSIPDGVDFVCLTDHNGICKPSHDNPYLARWIAYRDYLLSHPEYDNVFMVDATDVEVMVNPFGKMERGKLYVGSERSTLSNGWLQKYHASDVFHSMYKDNNRAILLNAGICGGDRATVLGFLDYIVDLIDTSDCGMTDMAIYNYTLYNYFRSVLSFGDRVNTVFKRFDKVNKSGSWFRHK